MQEKFDKERQKFYTLCSGGDAMAEQEERLGDRIRAMRERYGMPAAELARRVGITRQQLYMIENSKTADPGALTVLEIADALGVTTDYLLKGKRKTRRKADEAGDWSPIELETVGSLA
jgi:transcriptional regulator with XRE-family HTH domain